MSEESLETGGRSARRAVEEAGFSEDLRARLEEKIAAASFKSENASAFARVSLPSSAGKGTQSIAFAEPWTGTESVADASLRMLDDAHKPLRSARSSRAPVPNSIRGPPKAIDTGRPANKATGKRLANARDKSSIYSYLKDGSLSEDEREKYRKELKERFAPTARAIPATIQGLQSLANERIEDAIARGQFKNLPRGQKIERDYNASNPFLDTTEYFMNKLIQKQDIVPPWIEKQQELNAAVARFRAQLRATWRRHVARTIASRGGSLADQIRLAEQYALAEAAQSRPHVPAPSATSTAETSVEGALDTELKALSLTPEELREMTAEEHREEHETTPAGVIEDITSTERLPTPTIMPFRDTAWETVEHSYHNLAVQNLNNLTRSYNLMAPDLAKKPYYSLPRELRACFAEVAPQVAGTIRERALAPALKGVQVVGHKPGGVMERFSMDAATHVYDEQKPQYGFREFWRDLFSSKKA
ncbi:hypothetical protein AMS68_004976 [Peltaster fructicola]|uniref:DnaJ homologue subfamily C member 28 conserved domain-containing protein n=1 Tax=Peltaster fructicola TaxID=286661 RepID=A0A6H0XXW0_9PEZI|nr:hypothetical protein AMS68_004976 [Peltaster fructicola]